MASLTPEQVSQRLCAMADAIDASKNPDPARVAADIREVIAALSPKAAPAEALKSIKISFNGKVGDVDLMARAAAEIAKRRPGLKGRPVKFSLVAEPVDK